MSTRRRVAALLALCPLLLAAQGDCIPVGDEVDRYALSRCPDSTWSLPRGALHTRLGKLKGYTPQVFFRSRPSSECPRRDAFITYYGTGRTRTDSLRGVEFDLRLNRGPSCTLDVVREYAVRRHLGPDDRWVIDSPDDSLLAAERRGIARVIALVLDSAHARLSEEPIATARLSHRHLKRWCGAEAAAPLPPSDTTFPIF